MAFERLQNLGEEKFTKILNQLQRGEPAMALARTIQLQPPEGWGLFQDVAEKTLTQQLNRLREAAAEGMFGLRVAKSVASIGATRIKRLEHVSVRVLDRLETLADAQQTLVMTLLAKATEEKKVTAGTNDAVDGYRKVLQDIQQVRFNLGLDDYQGPTGTTVRATNQTTTFPDGMSVQKQVFEAVQTIERIFETRNIPRDVS